MSERYVLWVDDDEQFLKRSVERLERENIACTLIPEIDRALAVIERDADRIAGIILDVMMDPGKALAMSEHKGGFDTGLVFHDLIKTKFERSFPAFFLTNRDMVKPNYKGVSIYSKFEYKSDKLVKLVRRKFKP